MKQVSNLLDNESLRDKKTWTRRSDRYVHALHRICSILMIGGLMMDPSWSLTRKIFSRCLGMIVVCALFVPVTAVIGVLWKCLMNRDQGFEPVFAALTQLPVVAGVACSAVLFLISASKLSKFNTEFKETARFAITYTPRIAVRTCYLSWRQSNTLLNAYLVVDIILDLGWIILAPAFEIYLSYPHVDYGKIHLPLADQNWGIERTSNFWWILIMNSTFESLAVIAISLSYGLLPVLCILVEGQLNVLAQSLRGIQLLQQGSALIIKRPEHSKKLVDPFSGKQSVSKQNNNSLFGNEETEKIEDFISIKDCIKHHQMILRLVRDMKSFASRFLFLEAVSSILEIANCAVIASVGSKSLSSPLLLFTSLALLIHLIISVWYLMKIRDSCVGISFTASSMYQSLPKNLQRDVIPMITRSNCEEKFPCILTSSLTFAPVYQIIDLSWNYVTFASAIAQKHP